MPNPHLVLSCRFTEHGNQTIRREIRRIVVKEPIWINGAVAWQSCSCVPAGFFFFTNWWCSGFSFPHLCTSSKIDRETEMASCGNWWNEKSWWHFRAVISNPVAGLSTPLLIDTRKPETLSIVFDKSCLCKHWLEVAENPPWDKQNRRCLFRRGP